MINLFKKNIHSFLSFNLHTKSDTTATTICDYKLQLQSHHHHNPISGLGLITATKDVDRPMNVLESTTLKTNGNPPPVCPSRKNGPREIGFIDEVSGDVDGLMSCTESLGFESFDERRVGYQIHEIYDDDDEEVNDVDGGCYVWRRKSVMRVEGRRNWRKVRLFPPPLSSLNQNGRPSFFLRPVRKDGRLELTEVRIHRPEILHALRHDGRLTLHLIPDQSILGEEEEDEEEEEELEEEELVQQEQKEAHALQEEETMVEEEEEGEVVEEIRYGKEEEAEEDERVVEWKFGKQGNEGLRRCHEMVNHHHHVHGSHHHHHLHMCGISIV